MGNENLVSLVKRLQPKVVVPLVNAEFIQEGPLSTLIRAEGSPQALEAKLKAEGLDTVILAPGVPGTPVPVPV
jgi:hypothetical protein